MSGLVDRDAGREDGKIVEFTAVEGKVFCALRPDHHAKGGRLVLEQGLSSSYLNGLGGAADLHNGVDPCLAVELHRDAVLWLEVNPLATIVTL